MRCEMSDLKADIDQKFIIVSNDIQEQNEKIDKREQSKIRDKLEDLEPRSRRNNLRIYGIPEDTEKGQTLTFVKDWLSSELSIETDLQIQWALAAKRKADKPKADKPPRSVIVNFLQYNVKELLLTKAWEKKMIKIALKNSS